MPESQSELVLPVEVLSRAFRTLPPREVFGTLSRVSRHFSFASSLLKVNGKLPMSVNAVAPFGTTFRVYCLDTFHETHSGIAVGLEAFVDETGSGSSESSWDYLQDRFHCILSFLIITEKGWSKNLVQATSCPTVVLLPDADVRQATFFPKVKHLCLYSSFAPDLTGFDQLTTLVVTHPVMTALDLEALAQSSLGEGLQSLKVTFCEDDVLPNFREWVPTVLETFRGLKSLGSLPGSAFNDLPDGCLDHQKLTSIVVCLTDDSLPLTALTRRLRRPKEVTIEVTFDSLSGPLSSILDKLGGVSEMGLKVVCYVPWYISTKKLTTLRSCVPDVQFMPMEQVSIVCPEKIAARHGRLVLERHFESVVQREVHRWQELFAFFWIVVATLTVFRVIFG